jgi:hypothetical protein
VAHFDKAVPPGGKGKIALKIDTKGYQGNVTKTAVVDTNDPEKPSVNISLRCFVKVSITVSPRYVTLVGGNGQSVTSLVEIKAEKGTPLQLSPEEFTLGDKVAYSLEEVEKGKIFHIRFAGILRAGEPFSGHLRLRTNYGEKPEITIPIRGYIQKGRGPA